MSGAAAGASGSATLSTKKEQPARAASPTIGSGPAPPADITEAGTCQGLCVATWLTTFDPSAGAALSRPSAALTVPNGLGIDIDRRAEGDWYVSVLSLDGEDAEYRLRAELIDPPAVDDSYKCDKWLSLIHI